MNFAYWLKYYRKKAGYTQNEIASKLGMTRQNYSRYENEDLNAQPSLELLCSLAHLLKTDPNSLIGFQPIINEIEYAHTQLDNFEEKDNKILYRYLTSDELKRMNYHYFDNSHKLIIQLPKDKFIDFAKIARIEANVIGNAHAEQYKAGFFKTYINRLIFDYHLQQQKATPDTPISETDK